MRHPNHHELRSVVRQWYCEADPAMGYEAIVRPYGVYLRNVHVPQYGQATLNALTPDMVPACVADLRQVYGGAAVMLLIDDRAQADALDQALRDAGCERGPDEVFLAHVGAVPQVRPIHGITIEPVTASNLTEYAVTKIKAFRSNEAQPWPSQVADETALRHAEMQGSGCFLLARADGQPAAVIGWYDDRDVHIFQLATRVLFRNQGIARYLICHVLADAYARGCRSAIINADPADTPIEWYRRLGFTDLIYWRRRYHLFPPAR